MSSGGHEVTEYDKAALLTWLICFPLHEKSLRVVRCFRLIERRARYQDGFAVWGRESFWGPVERELDCCGARSGTGTVASGWCGEAYCIPEGLYQGFC